MSAQVLLNLLNKMGKSDKMQNLPSILSLFCMEFNEFNSTGAIIYVRFYLSYGIKITCKLIFFAKTSNFAIFYIQCNVKMDVIM